jgi:hypothetical protein
MGRPRKSLEQFCRDRTFLARKHAHLLADAPPLSDPVLAHLQRRYADEETLMLRRPIALLFEKAVRDPDGRAALARAGGEAIDTALRELCQELGLKPGKPLLARVLENTFTAATAHTLAGQPLPSTSPITNAPANVWSTLLELQLAYNAVAGSRLVQTRQRQAIARDFAALVQVLHGGPLPAWWRGTP